MTTINQLTAVDSLQAGDSVPVYDSSNGDARKASMTVLTAYMQANLTFSSGIQQFTSQHAAPSASGFSVSITDGDDNIHLILTPIAAYAAGTIVLPSSTNVIDKQEVLVNCTQAVTTLTINGNGSTVTGAPTSLSANDFFRLKYDVLNTTWYRVG